MGNRQRTDNAKRSREPPSKRKLRSGKKNRTFLWGAMWGGIANQKFTYNARAYQKNVSWVYDGNCVPPPKLLTYLLNG